MLARFSGGMAVGAASVLSPAVHLRSRPGEYPRPADDGAAGDDHHRPDRGLRGQLFPRRRRPAIRSARSAGARPGAGCTWRRRFPRWCSWSRCSSFPKARATSSAGATRSRRGVLTRLFGPDEAAAQGGRNPRQLLRPITARGCRRDCAGQGLSPDRVGRDHAGDLPAVRRHQHHFLLRRDAVEAGRRVGGTRRSSATSSRAWSRSRRCSPRSW